MNNNYNIVGKSSDFVHEIFKTLKLYLLYSFVCLHCDGGDIGSGTINIFTFVIDVDKALQTTLEELKNQQLLDGVKIAYVNDEEDYIQVYPSEGEFNLL